MLRGEPSAMLASRRGNEIKIRNSFMEEMKPKRWYKKGEEESGR